MQASEFLQEMDQVFNLDAGTIKTTDVLQGIDGWDSLTFMSLLMMIDEKQNAVVSPAAVLKCQTVGDLMCLVGISSGAASKAA